MEIRIKKTPGKIGLISNLTYVLTGVLISTSIIAISIQIFKTYGIPIGLILDLILTYVGFTYTTRKSILRSITWGILGMTTLSVLIAAAFYITIAKL